MSDRTTAPSTIAIDTGGTFTDVILSAGGRAYVLKVTSTPDDPARAALAGVQAVLAQAAGADAPALLIHGTTVATNALLERKGARVALITNAGFEDVIEIGRQNRPQLYGLTGTRAAPLVERAMRFGIAGRLDHEGRPIAELDDAELAALGERLAGAHAVAICLLHSYANPAHEEAVERALQTAGLRFVARSSALLPEYREYERTATTCVNAYVQPVMHEYLTRLEQAVGMRVRIMGSAGGALPVAAARAEPVQTVLSGPAGGVAGALAVARAEGIDHILTFDMGGTSTDVALCPGQPLHTRELSVAGVPVAIPVLDIHTVGAGGGSLAWLDAGGALRVGPRSAGALPGPICYGRGGNQVTVTDANVWLGRLPADAFLGGKEVLERAAIAQPLHQLAEATGLSPEETAAGVLTVINNTMAGALRVISVERGYDPADFTMVAFGGAAGLHAAELAAMLGVPRVMLPAHPGLLSAFGMLVSPVRKAGARTVLVRADEAGAADRMRAVFDELEAGVRAAMADEGVAGGDVALHHWIDARYAGQSHELRVPADNWVEELARAHTLRYGFADPNAAPEAVTLRVEAVTPAAAPPVFEDAAPPAPPRTARAWVAGDWMDVPVIARGDWTTPVTGPAIITEYSATTWVPAHWRAERLPGGALLMQRMPGAGTIISGL